MNSKEHKTLFSLHFSSPPQTSHIMEKESYLKTLFDILYYLLMVPFRIEKTKQGFFFRTNCAQKLCCAVVHLFTFISTVAYIQHHYWRFFVLSSDISRLLGTVGYMSTYVAVMSTIWVVWLRQKDILKFVNMSSVGKLNSKLINPMHLKLLLTVLILLTYVFNLVLLFRLDQTMTLAMHYIFGSCMAGFGSEEAGLVQKTLLQVFKIFFDFLFIQGCTTFMIPRIILIGISLQLKCLAKQFEELLLKHGKWLTVGNVLEEYGLLRNTVQCANSWAGILLLNMYVSMLAFLANFPGIIREESGNRLGRFYPVTACLILGTFLLVACDVPARVSLLYC